MNVCDGGGGSGGGGGEGGLNDKTNGLSTCQIQSGFDLESISKRFSHLEL